MGCGGHETFFMFLLTFIQTLMLTPTSPPTWAHTWDFRVRGSWIGLELLRKSDVEWCHFGRILDDAAASEFGKCKPEISHLHQLT